MTEQPLTGTMVVAMERLHWGLRDLVTSALQFGNVGTETEVGRHLAFGDRLTTHQVAVLVATLNDALMSVEDAFRVVAASPEAGAIPLA